MQGDGRLRRDRSQRPLLCKHACGLGRHGGVRLRGGHVRVGLRGGMQVFARMQHGAGRRGEIQGVRRVDQQVRPVDAFDVGIGRALAIQRLARGLAIHLARVATVLLRVQRFYQVVVAFGCDQGPRLVLPRTVVEAARGILRAAQQQQRFVDIGLRRLALLARRGRHQQALTRAQHGPGVRAQLEARAAPLAAAGVVQALFHQIAEAQLRRCGGTGQACAQLALGVVEDPLVAAGAVQTLAVPAAQHAGVVGIAVLSRGPGRQIRVVIQLAGHDRLIDIAVNEFDDDFGAAARQMMGAPVRPGLRAGHAQPGAGPVVAGRVAAGIAMRAMRQAARQRLLAALPGKLHLHAQVAIGRDGRVGGADHHGGQALGRGGARAPGRHERCRLWLRAEAVAIGAALHVRRVQDLRGLPAQVVGRFVRHVEQHVPVAGKLVDGLTAAALRVAVMLAQRENTARRKRAGRAAALEAHQPRLVRAHRTRRALFGGIVVGVLAVARVVVVFQHGQRLDDHLRLQLRGMRGQRSFVPRRARHAARTHGLQGGKARDAVAGFRGVAAVKAQGRRRVFRTRRVRIEDHHAVARAAASAFAIILLVLEAVAQAGLRQDALHERQVRFAVLRADRTGQQRVGEFEGERGLGIIRKHLADDVLHRQVLIDEAVAAQGQRRHPRRRMQAVARQSAIGAQRIHAFDHRVPVPLRTVGLQQADGDLLAQQGRHVQLGAGRQAIQRHREQPRDAFGEAHVLDDQFGVQPGR